MEMITHPYGINDRLKSHFRIDVGQVYKLHYLIMHSILCIFNEIFEDLYYIKTIDSAISLFKKSDLKYFLKRMEKSSEIKRNQ